jgi:G3E family GTPase
MSLLPVTLLTGFLGAGKSTLLQQVLGDPAFARTAVVVNEFGEIGLDGALVVAGEEQLVEMTSGCLCCTIRGDIRATLGDLLARRRAGTVAPFERLVVETTGLADPAPVIHTLMADPDLAGACTLAGVVTVVDTIHGADTLEHHAVSRKQVAVADRLVLAKAELARDPASRRERDELVAELRRLNPAAPVLDRHAADFSCARLFDTALYDPVTKSLEVRRWLAAEALESAHARGHHDHHHDVNRHGPDIEAFCLTLDAPMDPLRFAVALELLAGHKGNDLLRVKGIVCLDDDPDRPMVIHGVQHIFHRPVRLERWPDEDRRTRLVFITRGIRRETIADYLAAWGSEATSLWQPPAGSG